MPAQRSLPAHPNLRYFKQEAKQRVRSGEFATLHQAQRALAAEHGLPNWPAFLHVIEVQRGAESRVLPQIRWVISRFRDASEPGWAPSGEAELREHFSDEFMDQTSAPEIAAFMTGHGVDLSQEFTVTAQWPLHARFRLDGIDVYVDAEADPPHRITDLRAFATGARITGSRITAAETGGRHEVPAAVASIIEEAAADLGLPGLVLAGQAWPGAPIWTAATGLADLDRSEPMRAGHRFPASQISALITAVAVLRLVAGGRVGLDDAANDHLRTVALADQTVTIRELLTYTSGVSNPGTLYGEDVPDLAALSGPVLACGGPRKVFRFRPGSYAALGQLVADVTGTAYADAAARLVLGPLGMAASSFPASVAAIGTGVVTGYEVGAGRSFAPVPASIWTVPAACGLWTTAADLVRLAAGWSSLLPAELVRETFRPHTRTGPGEASVGLGWGIYPDGDRAGTGGLSLGTSAFLLIRRTSSQVQVALTNRHYPMEELAGRILDAIPPAPSSLATRTG